MSTVIITFLLLAILYLIFAFRHLKSDLENLEFYLQSLESKCNLNEEKIKQIKERISEGEWGSQGGYSGGWHIVRKSTNKYNTLLKTAVSKCIIYCNNGWSVSKTLLTKTKSKAYRLFERGIRPSYIRTKRKVQWLVYRAKERQEVISYQRAEDIHSERIG